MTTARDAFLQRVRQAVRNGNRAGAGTELGSRGQVGYHGAGADPVGRFQDELRAVGGAVHPVTDPSAAVGAVLDLVRGLSANKVLVGQGLPDQLALADHLERVGCEVGRVAALDEQALRTWAFEADLGITGADGLIAETGTVVSRARHEEPRSPSLLPPLHLVVARLSQVVPDLFDLFGSLVPPESVMPSCLTLITGPSKTGDIEMQLVTGVHGPGQVHVVLIAD